MHNTSTDNAGREVMAVDLRHLPAPEPMLAIMEALEQPVPAAGCWAFMLPHFPQPMLPRLDAMGMEYHVEPAPDYRGVVMVIRPAAA